MNSQTNLIRTPSPMVRRIVPVLAQERAIIALGNARQWDFRVLGVAPVPRTAVYIKEWWLVPLQEDTSAVPARALDRVRTLYDAGIRPKAFVIAHEAPKQITPPKEMPIVTPFAYWTKRAAESAIGVLKVTATVVAAVAPVLLTVVGTSLLVGVTVAGALVADPCLIAITDDDVWIQIDYWMA